MRTFQTPRALALTATFLATLLIGSLAPPALAESRHGIRLRVPYSVELPDGAVVPPGTLTIWNIQQLTPVATVHRLEASGRVPAVVTGRRKTTEFDAVTEPIVLFHRRPSGVLRLIGYVWSDGRTARAYLLVNDASPDRLLARRSTGTATTDDVVIVASLSGR